ncbi:hypothetical protein DENIS_4510 [Desulfonema ishimotonii]|uniref:Transmembrane protein n=1 Tax=Desulfonema ishimotonii TaxID=45657 RepID=A0A401G2S0_9BACT|nr:magnetosome protein MamC [Desulfonema ishimotonii]GBC63516.1 hypothetical protein DENIS_4510 [Desulfonema ishimotonii]
MSAHNTSVNPGQPVNANLNYQQYTQPINADYNYNIRQSGTLYPARTYYSTAPTTSYVPRASLMMAGVGAIVGGTAAAAKNIRRVREQQIDRREAVKDTAKEAAGAAVATGTATAVMGYVRAGSLVSLLGTIVVATGTKYLWDCATASAPAAAPCDCQTTDK